MNIAFFSSSALSIPLLEQLRKDFSLKLIVTNPDRIVGRNKIITPSQLKTWAQQNNIDCLTPNSLKKNPGNSETVSAMKQLNIELCVVVDYGLLIPESIFSLPKYQTINVHFSKLPKYRGPFPDAFVVLNKEKETAVSFVLIDKGFDTGDLLAQEKIFLKENETSQSLHEKLYQNTKNSITYIINSWVNYNLGKKSDQILNLGNNLQLYLPPKKQDNSNATYTRLLTREDGYIDWKILHNIMDNKPVSLNELPNLLKEKYANNLSGVKNLKLEILNLYLALYPWPGIWTKIKLSNGAEKRLKILKLHLENGNLILDLVQMEGKTPIDWKEFQKSYNVFV